MNNNPEVIISGEINIVHSLFANIWLRQFKYLLLPISLLILLELKSTWSVFILCITTYVTISIFFPLIALIKNRDLSSSLLLTFHLEIAKYCSISITFIMISLNAFHYIAYYWVIISLFANMAVVSVRLNLSSLPRTYIDSAFVDFLEAIQLIFIAMKYFDMWAVSWENTLAFYECFIYFIAFIGCMSAFFLPLMYGISSLHPEGSDQRKTFRFVCWIFFHVVFKSISMYYLFFNFLNYANENGLNPDSIIEHDDITLKLALYFMAFTSIINLYLMSCQESLLKKMISIKLLIIGKGKGVKREFVKVPFDMKIIQAGTNYFKNLVSTKILPKTIDIGEISQEDTSETEECMICCSNPSTTLVRPCNHSGFCETCIIQYLGTNTVCPHCKAPIKKIYVMKFDEENGKYMGEKVLTIIK